MTTTKKIKNISGKFPSCDPPKIASLESIEENEILKKSNFVPRQSQRYSNYERYNVKGDGDIWVEMKVVKRKKTNRTKGGKDEQPDANTRSLPWCKKVDRSSKDEQPSTNTRSLFYSINTGRAYWDEPPTGASRVILAEV